MNEIDEDSIKEKLTVQFLERTLQCHSDDAEKLALQEINSLEIALPRFNTIATLSRVDFFKLMKNIKKKYGNNKIYIALIAVITDTLTCMIKNNHFYTEYLGDTRGGLNLSLELLKSVKTLIKFIEDFEPTSQITSLISILKRSSARINNNEYNRSITEIITELQFLLENKENANKNKKSRIGNALNNNTLVNDINHTPHKPESALLKCSVYDNPISAQTQNKIPKVTHSHLKNIIKGINVSYDSYYDKLTSAQASKSNIGSPKTILVQAKVNTIPIETISSSKSKNAFDVMMLASKARSKKRKEI